MVTMVTIFLFVVVSQQHRVLLSGWLPTAHFAGFIIGGDAIQVVSHLEIPSLPAMLN